MLRLISFEQRKIYPVPVDSLLFEVTQSDGATQRTVECNFCLFCLSEVLVARKVGKPYYDDVLL